MEQASRAWLVRAGRHGERETPAGLRRLQDLRRELLAPPTPLRHTDPSTAERPAAVGDVA